MELVGTNPTGPHKRLSFFSTGQPKGRWRVFGAIRPTSFIWSRPLHALSPEDQYELFACLGEQLHAVADPAVVGDGLLHFLE